MPKIFIKCLRDELSVGRQASKGLVSKRLHDFDFFFFFLISFFFFGGGGKFLYFFVHLFIKLFTYALEFIYSVP